MVVIMIIEQLKTLYVPKNVITFFALNWCFGTSSTIITNLIERTPLPLSYFCSRLSFQLKPQSIDEIGTYYFHEKFFVVMKNFPSIFVRCLVLLVLIELLKYSFLVSAIFSVSSEWVYKNMVSRLRLINNCQPLYTRFSSCIYLRHDPVCSIISGKDAKGFTKVSLTRIFLLIFPFSHVSRENMFCIKGRVGCIILLHFVIFYALIAYTVGKHDFLAADRVVLSLWLHIM